MSFRIDHRIYNGNWVPVIRFPFVVGNFKEESVTKIYTLANAGQTFRVVQDTPYFSYIKEIIGDGELWPMQQLLTSPAPKGTQRDTMEVNTLYHVTFEFSRPILNMCVTAVCERAENVPSRNRG